MRPVIPIITLLACACAAADDDFDDQRDEARVMVGDSELFVVDGDLLVDEDGLRAWLSDTSLRSTVSATGGWTNGQERSLRYCVSDEFAANKPLVVSSMIVAARYWESLAHVDFVHVPGRDATCTGGDADVVFAVRPWGNPGGASFLPTTPPAGRVVLWNPTDPVVDGRTIWRDSILAHELGHALGLRHENIRPEAGGAGIAECGDPHGAWTALGAYDRFSLMQHPWCPAGPEGTVKQTMLDAQGVRALYGPPKIVTHAPVDRNLDGVIEIGQIVDCDGDRWSDLMLRRTDLVCARSLADGSFASSTLTGFGPYRDPALWGDFDGNGTLDYGQLASDAWDQGFRARLTGLGGGHHSVSAGAFPSWSMTENAARVVGRFDVGAIDDVALVGVPSWGTMPVMLVGGSPATVTNTGVGAFQVWAASTGVRIAPGDFDADGLTDLALVGGVGWGSVPIAFARGGGTWSVTNVAIADFAGWAALPTAVVHAGDFDGDGDSDLALTGPSGWGTIPVARSNRDGSFAVTNFGVASFPAWAAMAGANVLAADFDANGCTDLAVTGVSGWNSIPLALSQCNGGFAVHNTALADIPAVAAAGARPTIGWFDRDRRADIAFIGLPDRSDVPIALSRGTYFVPVAPTVATFTDLAPRPLSAAPP